MYFFVSCCSVFILYLPFEFGLQKNESSETQRLKKLTQSSFEMCAVNFPSIKFVMLPLNGLFLFCWSTLGALMTESKDLFYDCEDTFDLVLG